MGNEYSLLAKKASQRYKVKCIEIDFIDFHQLNEVEDALYHIKTDALPIDILVLNGSKVDGLYLLSFNGALSERARKEKYIPNFTGVNVADEVGVGLVAVNDPITYLDDNIYIGWYLGVSGSNFQVQLLSLIQHIAKVANVRFCSFGGSGGGFASLSFLQKSEAIAKAYVWNCQTVIHKYYPRFWKYYSKVAYNVNDPSNEEFERLLDNERVSSSLINSGVMENKKPFLYLQNSLDWHLDNHALPLVECFLDNYRGNGFYVFNNKYFFQGCWGAGHAVPPKDLIIKTLSSYLRNDSRKVELHLDSYIYFSGKEKIQKTNKNLGFDIAIVDNKIEVLADDAFSSSAALYYKVNGEVVEKYAYRESKAFLFDIPLSFVGISYVIFIKYLDGSIQWREVGESEIVQKLNQKKRSSFHCSLKKSALEITAVPINKDSFYCFCLVKNESVCASTGYSVDSSACFEIDDKDDYSVIVYEKNNDVVSLSKGGVVAKDREKRLAQLKVQYSKILSGGYETLNDGFTLRKDLPKIKIHPGMSWKHADRNGEFELHTLRFLSPIWGRFFETEDQKYIEEVVVYLKSWHNSIYTQKSNFYWYDMAVGIRAMHISLLINLSQLYPLSDADVVFFRKIASEHVQNLVNPRNLGHGNHAIYQLIGLKSLLLATSCNRASYYEYCNKSLADLISSIFDENCINVENSPFYHGYNLGLLSQIPIHLFPELKNEIKAISNKASSVKEWLSNAKGEYYIIGDTEGRGAVLDLDTNLYDFVASRKYVSKDYGSSGYQVIRTHPEVSADLFSAFVFHATNKSKIHSHCDHLSFILYWNGVEVITDSGKYTYENNSFRSFIESDRAHNTFGISDRSFFPGDVDLNETKLKPMQVNFNQKSYRLGGRTQRGGVYLERDVVFKPMVGVDIYDFIESDILSKKEIRYHFGPGLKVKEEGGTLCIFSEDCKLCTIEFNVKPLDIEIFNGSLDGYLGWVSYEYNAKISRSAIVATFDPSVAKVVTSLKWL
ncbi:hypothetical protein HME01_07000 [Vreelandella aquamarina]|uniref:Heparinase II/III N-terminus n=1 Tax=Vreelandella aquamarina TaxID=77097 RepID=A0A1N6FZM0_9GAMM|nr:heparinase II/III family protein [Halomonas meridiana]GED44848.1 hypothetical protein HME01_07000 [Halomonas meridiana]SIN61053.1 Heparinase II/III N-terminus [Halomonas meridiana]SIN66041.1 Heparinase II/III N-terminus [Halomonas meridiana]SIO00677.1 Heparinase II/III N-terminus [Halomonas meridiana]